MSKYVYQTTIPEDVRKNIEKEVKNVSPFYEVRNIIRYAHPDDNYLYKVVAENVSLENYTYWGCFNTSTNSLNFGHYGLALEEAMSLLWEN